MKKLSFAALLLLGAACSNDPKKSDEKVEKFSSAYIDSTQKPCDDFYLYAVGKWLKTNPIPADQSSWGSFEILVEQNNNRVASIIKDLNAQKSTEAGSPEQMVRDFYTAAMDSTTRVKNGTTALTKDLAAIDAAKDIQSLVNTWYTIEATATSSCSPYSAYVGADDHNSKKNVLTIFQGGLNLPEKDYYLATDPAMQGIRKAYAAHITKMLGLAGVTDAKAGDKILSLETALAKISISMNEMRDPDKLYNKMSAADANALAPSLMLTAGLEKVGVKTDSMIVAIPTFMKGLEGLLKSISVDDWKLYTKWQIIHGNAAYLSPEIEKENFDFYGKTLNGQPQMRPADKRAIRQVNAMLGESMGRLFVKKYFPEESKKYMSNMVEELRASYKTHIENLDWMSAETKKKALEKLKKFTYKIGYPNKWKDLSSVKIKADDYFGSIVSVRLFQMKDMFAKLSKPVDKDEWGMNPHEVNAYYNPSNNEVVFPAGILQPPFFHISYDDALNYGGIGAVIGHEFTHGFDDQGAKFDGDGNRVDWWAAEDFKKFNEKGAALAKLFSSFEPIKGVHINGEMTLGENIADLGGLSIAYTAFQNHIKGKNVEKIDGMTPEQRFFFGFANVWKGNEREESLLNQIKSDFHSPGPYRVRGTLRNIPAFYEAFGCKPKEDILKIW